MLVYTISSQTNPEKSMPETIQHGQICWSEVYAPNAEAARDFYTALFGWEAKQEDFGGTPYTTLSVGGKMFGGIMPMVGPQWQGVPPHWMTYFAVEDVDASAAKVKELGGNVCVPPTDIPVGRFAVVSDPTGATFSLFKGK
jgi:predicted enzyme related to lactoylglutathione lyase